MTRYPQMPASRPQALMFRLLILGCCLALPGLALPGLAQADFDAVASSSKIDDSESVLVTFSFNGDSKGASPDFTPLESNFDILFSRREEQIRMGLGGTQRLTEWQVTLVPKRRGVLEIPSLLFLGERSPTLRITVSPPSPSALRTMQELVFFDTRLDRQQVYVQAQLLYTVALYYAADVQLYGDVPPAPSIDNAIVQPVGNVDSLSETRNGRRYQVIRQRYAIFPQASGSLSIPGEAMSVSARLPARPGQRASRRELRIRSEAKEVSVLPPPADWPQDQPWLPAADLQLAQDFQPAGQTLQVGVPVNRDVLVKGEGVAASLLPDLPMDQVGSARVYPDPPVLEEQPDSFGITALRLHGGALIPTEPGQLVVPPLRVTWYDVNANRVRLSQLPEQRFQVLPAAGAANNPLAGSPQAAVPAMAPTGPSGPTASAETPAEDPAQPPASGGPQPSATRAMNWLLATVLALMVLGWSLAIWGWRRLLQLRRQTRTDPAASPAATASATRKQLLAACRNNNPGDSYRLLLQWQGERRLAQGPGINPIDSGLQEHQGQLEQLLFGRQAGQPPAWQGAALAAAVQASSHATATGPAPATALAPLYGR